MTPAHLKVLFVSAEVAPFSSVGGLSQVSFFLTRALYKMGVDIRIFTPKYGTLDEQKFPTHMVLPGLSVPTNETGGGKNPKELICNVKSFAETKKREPTVYLLENMEYFEKRANVYGYSDDHIRFGLLSRGALEFIKKGFFVPDLIHVNDWHTGYLVNFLREEYKDDPGLAKIATLLSVHNLFQGNFDFEHASQMDFDDGKGRLSGFFTDQFLKQNALRRGVISADVVNTVSETYATEITREEFGRSLASLFKELRGKLYGVLNGLDYSEFNPATDKVIKRTYNGRDLKFRVENKLDLQKIFGLTVDPAKPLVAIWGRLVEQKGLDLVLPTIEFALIELGVQLVVMGGGDDKYRDFFANLEKKFPGQVGTHLRSDFILPRKIIAGADMALFPSRYEPGGIVAMEAMRYGCVPIARAVGGLADSISDYDPETDQGTGFLFKKFANESFLVCLARALEVYKNKKEWVKIMRRAMEADFSWTKSAEKYFNLYHRAVRFRKEALLPNPPRAFRET